MRKIMIAVAALLTLVVATGCEDEQMKHMDYSLEHDSLPSQRGAELAALDISRAIALTDSAVAHHFTGAHMTMQRYYNPYTQEASTEVGSVWMYTSAIEAVNSVLLSLNTMQKLVPDLYAANHDRYVELLGKLYDGLEYYRGSTTITSYTQTRKWEVYAVNRGNDSGSAVADGNQNVYDDQEWLIREMLRSYKVTDNAAYLQKAEALTEYVLDGWDCTLNSNGEERGGITWGPSYTSKHSCSNGPLIASLVWLYENYRNSNAEVTYKKIDASGQRYDVSETKAAYYLGFAKKIYSWQKRYLLNTNGIYGDLVGASSGSVQYETVDGERYRKGLDLKSLDPTAYTYNSGAMLSAAAELYRVTRQSSYLTDAETLISTTAEAFAEKDADKMGFYTYPIDGFSPWFNDVLLRGYADALAYTATAREQLDHFQGNLDFAWANYLYRGFLPTNLLVGWSWTNANNKVEGMFTFAYASEYAMLANTQWYNVSDN